jgi:hypothetical protein
METVIILGVLIIVYLIYTILNNYLEIRYVKSTIDNKIYMIRRGNNKSEQFLVDSANTLAKINTRITSLIEHLESIYSNDTSKNYFIRKLRQNYNSYMISEAALDLRYTTYTVDKEDMHICLRTRDQDENIYDINTLMYVCVHELAHLCNYTIDNKPIQGHGREFKMIFKFLIEEAIKIGVYKYVNYALNPQEYCGLIISTSIL